MKKLELTEDERKEKKRASSREDYRKHKERYKEAAKKWAAANPIRRKEIVTKWGINNSEKKKMLGVDYYHNNKQRIAKVHRAYIENNPEIKKDKDRRRRARERNAVIELFSRLSIYDRDEWLCKICGRKVDKRLSYPHPESSSLDHIIPISKGGNHTRDNVQLAHLTCNKIKFNKVIHVDKENPRVELEIRSLP